MNDFINRIKNNSNNAENNNSTIFKGNGVEKGIFSPVNGQLIGRINFADNKDYENILLTARSAFLVWRKIPAPKRGEIMRQFGEKLRFNKQELGNLVSYEMGKSVQEGLGEVQEMIDICEFATGLSRQLYGLQMHSERPNHRMIEQWHPLGVVGIISAFNFPVAVWAWNLSIALICGNVCIWKPSEKTPFTALACQLLLSEIIQANKLPEGISGLILGDQLIGEIMSKDSRIDLISATGSVNMGKKVAVNVASRLGKSLLELGGNNAIIITENATLNQAVPAILFGAVGTCGQRCTSTRRLIVQEKIYETLKIRLLKAYKQLRIGNPLNEKNHVGPLIDKEAVNAYLLAIREAENQGGKVIFGNEILDGPDHPGGLYVIPTLIEAKKDMEILKQETFAPILYLIKYVQISEAIEIQNAVPQGLSSAIFTNRLMESEFFLSTEGSDCGIANVNVGTSGAEIGGAFGGEKETGGGRESGSDSWKSYMRRQTCTINFGNDLPLAQGIKFDI